MQDIYFSDLLTQVAERSRQAAISRLGFGNVALRHHMSDMFGRAYGVNGSFLGDPTFEAVFGWKPARETMRDLVASTLLSQDLVDAMDAPPKDLADEYRFAATQHPYEHQLQAWRILKQLELNSIIVASGTGSGKTECFMVPILDRLARLRQQNKSQLIGVRALFLYPLNALINSQRDRLRAWTSAFSSDVRFSLYNGNTPEELPARDRHAFPNEVLDRATLRSSPPPILVTNATMLEYMLVRTVDKPILDQSQGKLEWVVLDEAHTYVGSQAAEVALLIRRVLAAFGVSSDQVRFIATSATLGDPNGDAGVRLRRFLADVAGVADNRVHLVHGSRDVPALIERIEAFGNGDSLPQLAAESVTERYVSLCRSPTARRVRDIFVGDPSLPPVARLSEVCKATGHLGPMPTKQAQHEALRWLDLLSGTTDVGGVPFLPLRAHLFHQTLSNVWACANAECSQVQGTRLEDPEWTFGAIHLEPRKHCSCGSPVYEVVTCGECGEVHLLAGIRGNQICHMTARHAVDEFELESEPHDERGESEDLPSADDGDDLSGSPQSRLLITGRKFPETSDVAINRATRIIEETTKESLRVNAYEDDGYGLLCPACGTKEFSERSLLRASTLGAPFLLGGILPTLLEFAPDGNKPAEHPYRGRRLLTFNDSRQGTARMAAKLQQDSERTRVRGLVYHLAIQHGSERSTAAVQNLSNEIQTLEVALASVAEVARVPLAAMVHEKKARRAALTAPTPIPFIEMAQLLAAQGGDFDRMLAHYGRLSPDGFGGPAGPIELAQMLLIREFGRRPKRLNSLESMGLVSVRYPALDEVTSVPDTVRTIASFNTEDWVGFLKICLDYCVRANGCLEIPQQWRSWLGMPFPQYRLVPQEQELIAQRQRRWPSARRGKLRSTLTRLLAHVIGADVETAAGQDNIDEILRAAWSTLCRLNLLVLSDNGRVLRPASIAFSPIHHAWVCPFTRRLLDTTLRSVSPYTPRGLVDITTVCERVQMPVYDEPFGGLTDDQERVLRARSWIESRSDLGILRDQGLWSNLNDRVVELAPFFTAAEHSAQQDSAKLDRYERAFKAGDLNLLSCSTTMEMGIDIGGISMVAMNNVPPHPANYLQRAGRAGRRREARSVAMTLCKSNPHDQSAYANSRWAFDCRLPAPHVALDSPVLVQRHINAFLLTHFLADLLATSGIDKTKLTCRWFFAAELAPSDRFCAWARDFNPKRMEGIARDLKHIVCHSVYEGTDTARLAWQSAEALDRAQAAWRSEWNVLGAQQLATSDTDVAQQAVLFRITRMGDEYLLRELSTRGFLPGYGFPAHISSFDNLNVAQFKKMKASGRGREDNSFRRRELPSRDRITALREYAPGSQVVMDGLVYRSSGITLNWHMPATERAVREVQSIRYAWRCRQCGASGSSHNIDSQTVCGGCGTAVALDSAREFLEPAGFAVDFYEESSNDISTQQFVPVEAPWISAEGDWLSLPNPDLGRFRVTTRGHVFHQSRGINGAGYALCLTCGRAEPMPVDNTLPFAFQKPHRMLRGARHGEPMCRGSDDSWKVKKGLTLGHEAHTDVLEIQLKTDGGEWLVDRVAALTIAVAMRDALAETLGVQAAELGCDIKESRPDGGRRCQSILVYDTFAAGYASGADRFIERLFALVQKRLQCVASCDSVCPHCVLSFDQRFAVDSLNRHIALDVLTTRWLEMLSLPKALQFFGLSSRVEYTRLSEAILREAKRDGVHSVRLFAGGDVADWDVAISPLRDLVYRLTSNGCKVLMELSACCVESAESVDRHLLASFANHPSIEVRTISELPEANGGRLMAEVVGGRSSTVRWGVDDIASLAFGPMWGVSSSGIIVGTGLPMQGLAGERALAEQLRPINEKPGDREIDVQYQLDGPLQGFGGRFWDLIASTHEGSGDLLTRGNDDVCGVHYYDRYLLTPLTLALLTNVISQLRELVGRGRWGVEAIDVTTTDDVGPRRSSRDQFVWTDWPDLVMRRQVLFAALRYEGIETNLKIEAKADTQHARLLKVFFESGCCLTIRMDQGVSYWRAAAAARATLAYDFGEPDVEEQGRRISELAVQVQGGSHPTQLFLKIRKQSE